MSTYYEYLFIHFVIDIFMKILYLLSYKQFKFVLNKMK